MLTFLGEELLACQAGNAVECCKGESEKVLGVRRIEGKWETTTVAGAKGVESQIAGMNCTSTAWPRGIRVLECRILFDFLLEASEGEMLRGLNDVEIPTTNIRRKCSGINIECDTVGVRLNNQNLLVIEFCHASKRV